MNLKQPPRAVKRYCDIESDPGCLGRLFGPGACSDPRGKGKRPVVSAPFPFPCPLYSLLCHPEELRRTGGAVLERDAKGGVVGLRWGRVLRGRGGGFGMLALGHGKSGLYAVTDGGNKPGTTGRLRFRLGSEQAQGTNSVPWLPGSDSMSQYRLTAWGGCFKFIRVEWRENPNRG